MEIEGIIKYKTKRHDRVNKLNPHDIEQLNYWRNILYEINLIGEYKEHRVGFGNISERIDKKAFIISSSQTGSIQNTTTRDYSIVENFELDSFEIEMSGELPASSESLTHAAIYESNPDCNFIIHIHHKKIWELLIKNNRPSVPATVKYGTIEMANFFREKPALNQAQCFAMEGHEDGIIIFANSIKDCGQKTLETFKDYIDL